MFYQISLFYLRLTHHLTAGFVRHNQTGPSFGPGLRLCRGSAKPLNEFYGCFKKTAAKNNKPNSKNTIKNPKMSFG